MKKRVTCSFKFNPEARYLLIRFSGSIIYPTDIDICALSSFKKIKESARIAGSKIWLIIDFSFLDLDNFVFIKEIDDRIKNMLSENVEDWVAISRSMKQRMKLNLLSTFYRKDITFYSSFLAAENAIVDIQAKRLFA
ncbi:MAG: hypothetical protein R2883_05280 [Caldisericia bacterium]